MPVGCVHQFIVVKRKSVLRALESAVENGHRDKEPFARMLLSRVHLDMYLIAIEDMGGTDHDVGNLLYLGLTTHDEKVWLDFYAPHLKVLLPAKWLRHAPLPELKANGSYGQFIWLGYRYVNDKSTSVSVWQDPDNPVESEPFPHTSETVV